MNCDYEESCSAFEADDEMCGDDFRTCRLFIDYEKGTPEFIITETQREQTDYEADRTDLAVSAGFKSMVVEYATTIHRETGRIYMFDAVIRRDVEAEAEDDTDERFKDLMSGVDLGEDDE
ncbi:hypothetical protein HQ529_03645 [Candidatus Woesearchaeota archaeon]|nr:hypothetical protein [Candidatus Woesearchaeota archaeon]